MKKYMIPALLCVMLAGCFSDEAKQTEKTGPEDIFSSEMTTVGFYPASFTDTDSGCRCVYVVKNATDKDLKRLRTDVTVHSDAGDFQCDIGLGFNGIKAGEIKAASNLKTGQKCGNVQSVEVNYTFQCEFGDGSECDDANFIYQDYKHVTWDKE